MIELPVKEFPNLQNRSFFLRTMEDDRYQSEIEQSAQYPCQPSILLFRIPVFQRNMQYDINQEDDPYSFIQDLYLLYFPRGQGKTMFVNYSDNQQQRCQIRECFYQPQYDAYIGFQKFILI